MDNFTNNTEVTEQEMSRSEQYLDRLLARYSGTFDIYVPYTIGGTEFPAYGYFFSHVEKFVLTRNTNMWSSDSYEHIFFLPKDSFTVEDVVKMKQLMLDYAEPQLVRKGQELPDPNHMYSYMSIILISNQVPDKSVIKAVKKLSFDKGYQMNMRGYSQIQICLVSMEDEKIYHNFASSKKKKILKGIFKEVREGKIGFKALCEKQGIEPFKQDEPIV